MSEGYLRLIFDGAHVGQFNMAVDELLFRKHIEQKNPDAILRFYQFSEPTLTIGYGIWKAAGNERKK